MTLTKIGTDGVKDDAITSGKIPANAVGSSELADNAVDTAAIADDAVTAAKIADNSITATQLAADSVSYSELAVNAVGNENISNGSISSGKMASNSVATAAIQDQAVTLDKLSHGTSSNDGKFLRANNGADPSFETVTSTTINNNADNRVITGSGTANTLNGESNLTFDGSNLAITGELDVHKSGTGDIFHVQGNGTGSVVAKVENAYNSDNDRFAILELKSGKGSIRFNSNGDSNEGAITYNMADNTMVFGVNNASEKLRIQSGGGISFNGDTAAANALDDYEEGTFTPTILGNNSSSNQSGYAWRYGTYTKIGRLVHVRVAFGLSDGFASNFTTCFLGIPLTAYSDHGASNFDYVPLLGYSYNSGYGDDANNTGFYLEISGHAVNSFRIVKGNGKSNINQNDLATGQRFAINFWYQGAA